MQYSLPLPVSGSVCSRGVWPAAPPSGGALLGILPPRRGGGVCLQDAVRTSSLTEEAGSSLTPLQALLGAEEKFPGLWLGSLLACLTFCFACMAYDANGDNGLDILGVDSIAEEPVGQPFHITNYPRHFIPLRTFSAPL